ncbi:MAG: DUF5304 family protein [Acidimicrobiia bacterium]
MPDDDATPRKPEESGASQSATKAAEALVSALREAGPEATEHLLNAARELLAAAKAVIEASERIVAERQSETPKVERIDLE